MRALLLFLLVRAASGQLLRDENEDMSAVLPETRPTDRFFKYSFNRLDRGDVKSLAVVMREAYLGLCRALHGCHRAEAELEELYQRRFVELNFNVAKMQKLGMVFQRLIASSEPEKDEEGRGLNISFKPNRVDGAQPS